MIYVTTTIKYWLIITMFAANGEVVERHEIRYKNEVACYQAMDSYPSNGLSYQAECVGRNIERGYNR